MKSEEFREIDPKLPANLLLSSIIYTVAYQYLFANGGDDGFFEASQLTNVLLYGLKKR